MKVESFVNIIGAEFYAGVPDSQLKALCNYLNDRFGTDSKQHVIAANEGNAVALAAGYHLATGKVPVCYMQNSGEGNIINPVASLLNEKVYGIPMIFVIGWRGEPGIHDEPQHIYQGEVTIKLLDDMGIASCIVDKDTTEEKFKGKMAEFRGVLGTGKQVAFVIRKGALTDAPQVIYANTNTMRREDIIKHIVEVSGEDPIVSTTGKASRELFEIRVANNQSHKYDFLTVGSMGHSSSIALGIAENKPEVKIWCIDGDGAVLMHMGAMAVIGAKKPKNLIHIVINNESHETVGGMPTVANFIDMVGIAKACGYESAVSVSDFDTLDKELMAAKNRDELSFIEVKCAIGAREDLGRPTTTARENREKFMEYLNELN
ncbi:MAG: phosphonopyruvate decarboxylase [Lachnospiraceae bacterium]|nr:phosphonopyruvate decarboxylase [Lachnospiraceae bacterium]